MVDQVKKEIYKKARLQGDSKQEALKKAGYAVTTAEHSQNCTPLAKIGDAELCEEFLKYAKVDIVLGNLLKEAQNTANKPSDRIRAWELVGKYLQMFKEESKQGIAIFNNVNDLQKDIDLLRSKRTVSDATVEPKQEQ
jgi:hypothetical protein